jgi:hypothetical protein
VNTASGFRVAAIRMASPSICPWFAEALICLAAEGVIFIIFKPCADSLVKYTGWVDRRLL